MEITQEEIIDWYDGLVEALVKVASDERWHYLSLMAWDQAAELTVSALLPLSPKWETILLRELREEPDDSNAWARYAELREAFLKSYSGDVQVLLCGKRDRRTISQKRVDFEAVRGFLGKGVEACLDSQTSSFWISELNK
jgi:hypothetical protein